MSKSSGWRTRRIVSSEFKEKVALAVLREDKTLAELCQQYEVHPNRISDCKKQFLAGAADVFAAVKAPEVDLRPLHAKIGQLALENPDLQHRSGVQFTAQEFVNTVIASEATLSMDGPGAWRADLGFCHNVFVERVWRSVVLTTT